MPFFSQLNSFSTETYTITLKIKSFDVKQLLKICVYIKKMCKFYGAKFNYISFLPLKKKHISVCRSPHIHKKSRTQLIVKRYKIKVSFNISSVERLQETLFFFKTSYLPGVEYELCVSEKAYIF